MCRLVAFEGDGREVEGISLNSHSGKSSIMTSLGLAEDKFPKMKVRVGWCVGRILLVTGHSSGDERIVLSGGRTSVG